MNVLEQPWWHERLALEHIALVQNERSERKATDNKRCNYLRALPRVRLAAPRKAHEEEYYAGDVEEDANEIEFLKLLPLGLAADVQLVVGWRVIQELVQDEC